ncbi:MAG TPA: M3 family metallopeptidase [Salinivirgaceae bacterium]|nr:M3 family metallopeptidase [Salinivirgaceae bacterium]
MKFINYLLMLSILVACSPQDQSSKNPFFVKDNKPIDYAKVTAQDIEDYANHTLKTMSEAIEQLKNCNEITFDNIFVALDDIYSTIYTADNNCFMLYWTSPDSLSREVGLKGHLALDSLSTTLYSNKQIFDKMQAFLSTDEYKSLQGHRKIFVDDLILHFTQSGVNLDGEKLAEYEKLTKEIGLLTSEYSNNMNSARETVVVDEKGAEGLPENFKNTYKKADNTYEIPVINATRDPILKNAACENTRKEFFVKYNTRAADKNLDILNNLVQKRYQLAQVMGYETYADYNLVPKMAKDPETVWNFINDLVERAKPKAKADIEELRQVKATETGNKNSKLEPWDIAYYNNQILKTKFDVDYEKVREYLPINQCLQGILDIFNELLGLEFRKIENASVWHPDVLMYDVYDNNTLKGRVYLDLFPRPNKESWFYGVRLTAGKKTEGGYQIPISMLLGNFTPATDELPSLISFKELNTLFHEFGHIVDGMSYDGEFALQARAKTDFVESMSQIFENWTWDYDILKRFAKHYKTNEVLPKELFDNMVSAKNVSSGYFALNSLRNCIYDMNLYNLYNPEKPLDTDELWRKIDKELGIMNFYVEGTHPQASWIHINTHPVYYYGYLWAEVYAQDMFTEFEKNGLLDLNTGLRFRKLILSNGKQRDVVKAVEEFLGRPSNNEAYIKSLGLN